MKLNYLKLLTKFFCVFSLMFSFANIQPTFANDEFSNLTYCKDSNTFKKRLITSVKKLENRLSIYEKDSKEYLALTKKIQSTKDRFEKYEKANLLCGKEGLPRIIATGQWNHSNEFIFPGLLFLYITGWIGWVGRKYLKWASTTENSFENEIIINLPLALSIMNSGFLWPLDAWKELVSGELIASDKDITISPR